MPLTQCFLVRAIVWTLCAFANRFQDQGQGGAQAIEDAVALGIALTNYKPGTLESRLQLFEEIRRNRASVMTIFSNAGQDEPEKIQMEAAKFIPAEDVPSKEFIFVSFFRLSVQFTIANDLS